MVSQLTPIDPTVNVDPFQAAQLLGSVLSETPEYKAFLAASKAVNSDATVQKLSRELCAHQTALQWGRDPDGQHTAELTRLELEIEDLQAMQEYRATEKEVSVLFQAVDKIISQEAGVDFAVNAQHTGCSCGG
jgi:cell fate (sporulation/competence/biofilm development) regulator YlbF (YheA/YmcA/DUF963 family)